MKTYKGFNSDMTCQPAPSIKPFQYKEGKTFESTDTPVRCASGGFHSCKNPLDVITYYPPGTSVYHECEVSGEIDSSDDDSKIASSKITIGNQLSITDLCSAAVSYMKRTCTKKKSTSGYQSIGSASGYRSIGSASGYRSSCYPRSDWSKVTKTMAADCGLVDDHSGTGTYTVPQDIEKIHKFLGGLKCMTQ